MKRLIDILLMLAALSLAAACVKHEEMHDKPGGEIAVRPVVSKVVEGSVRSVYPEGETMGVYSFLMSGDLYTDDQEFEYKESFFGGVEACYWPYEGSLVFAGYSPYRYVNGDKVGGVTFDFQTGTLSVDGYATDGKSDFMYFLPELSDGDYVGFDESAGTVLVRFNHALSLISFEVKAQSSDGAVRLKEIRLRNLARTGDFSVTAVNGSDSPTGVWTNTGNASDYVVWESAEGELLSIDAPVVAEALVIPGNAADIDITYEVTDGATVSKTAPIAPADYIGRWEVGQEYLYSVTLSAQKAVVVTPSATVGHIYENGVLTGSEVTVNLGDDLSEADLAKLKNLRLTVTGGDVEKTYSASVVNSREITFSGGNARYMPQGTYTVTCEYEDDFGVHEKTTTCTSPAPAYSFIVDVSTEPGAIVVESARVTISDEVLAEVNLKNIYVRLLYTSYADFRFNTSSSTSVFILNETCDVEPGKWQMVQTSVVFDGVNVTANVNNSIFTVPIAYVRGNQVTQANQIKDGGLYVLCAMQSTFYYWAVDTGSGAMKFESGLDASDISKDFVFRYDVDDSKTVQIESGYYTWSSVGTWYSVAVKKYMSTDTYPYFNQASPVRYVKCSSGWGSSSGSGDIDMSKGVKELLRYGNPVTSIYWGDNGAPNQYWKWYVYEVDLKTVK